MTLTLLAIIKKPHNSKFIQTVKDVLYELVDEKEIKDKTNSRIIAMIKKAIEGVKKGIFDTTMLFEYCKSDSTELNEKIFSRIDEPIKDDLYDDIVSTYSSFKLSPSLIKREQEVYDAFNELKVVGLKDKSDSINKLKKLFNEINKEMSQTMSVREGKTLEFEVDKIIGFDETVEEMKETETFRVYTDTAFDDHVGGFAPTKIYNLVGIPGGGKSLSLLNIALSIKDNNKFTPDVLEGRKPIVIYITLENTRVQTFKRALAYYGINSNAVDNMTKTELQSKCFDLISPKGEFDIRFSIKQYKRYTVNGNMMTNIINEYSDNGYKVVALVVDYLALIEYNYDMEDKFNAKMPIVKKAEDLKNVAIDGFTPVITASQTNKNGENAIYDAIRSGKNVIDPIRSFSGTHIAGGYQLKGEFDFLMFIYKGILNNADYLSIKSDKERDYVKKDKKRRQESQNSGSKLSVIPLDGFRLTDKTLYSAADLFPEDKTTVNILSEGNKNFKKMVDTSDGNYNNDQNKKRKDRNNGMRKLT